MKIIFLGASRFVLPVIQMLEKNFDLALVVTTERSPSDAVPFYCNSNNIPYLSVAKFDIESKKQLKKVNVPLGILAYFGVILPADILNLFPKGILNIHPSLLPHYRGATPVQSAILNGDCETGVTIIRLDEQMDHGPILSQEKQPIYETDTAEILYDRLMKKGASMMEQIIPEYLSGKATLKDQSENEVTYTKRSLKRQDGYVDIENPPSKEILDRMIRAYYPWPGVWTVFKIEKKELRIKLLPGKNIQVEGKKPVTYKDFINGYPQFKEKLKSIFLDFPLRGNDNK